MLIGVNLLREGLDLPEVSLVAILDADKEGFLRSDRSLIQTIGRAARHLNGKAILFADKITNSMQRAMDETERRRTKQIAHNKKHGITPKGVNKKIADIMEGAVVVGKGKRGKVAEKQASYSVHPELEGKSAKQKLAALEEKMYDAAKDLDFEKAASLRDQIKQLKLEFVQFNVMYYATLPLDTFIANW